MDLDSLRSVVSQPWNMLAVLAGNSLGWQVVVEFISGVTTAFVDPLWFVGTISQWLLYFYVTSEVALEGVLAEPPDWIRDEQSALSPSIAEYPAARILVGFFSTLLGALLGTAFPPDVFIYIRDVPASVGSSLGIASVAEVGVLLIGTVGVSVVVFVLILARDVGWFRLAPATQAAVWAQSGRLDAGTLSLYITEADIPGWQGEAAQVAALFNISVRLSLLCVVFGLTAIIGVVLFPLPEMAILGLTAYIAITGKENTTEREFFAVGSRLRSLTRYCLRSRKGGAVLGAIILGTAMAAVLVFANTLLGLTILHHELQQAWAQRTLSSRSWGFYRTLGFVGGVVTQMLVGPYTLWFWLREMYRVPQYLQEWEREHRGTVPLDTQDADLPSPVARPRGGLVVPMSLLLFLSLTAASGSSFDHHPFSAMVYTTGSGALLYLFYATRAVEEKDIRSADDEGKVILSAVALQFVAFVTWISVGRMSLESAVVIMFLIVPALVLGFYLPEISLGARHGHSKHLIWVGVFAMLLILGSLEALFVSPIAWLLVVLGLVGLLLVLLDWLIEGGTS
ncbi:hypothetical protein [Haloarchaeobius amylolyticus]|uniref:hypothetical protein n=1 Tax=Haloarchaeobius amylolyticus TaxID=1198296 RepID=UPI00226FC440|nr:hypothetical protein [Haloarchaeobius amylolyticus]